jgi:hypothetical protein
MDEEREIAKAKAYIVKMRESAKAFTEALGLPPEDMPAVFDGMYQDGHLPKISEEDIEQARQTRLPEEEEELKTRILDLIEEFFSLKEETILYEVSKFFREALEQFSLDDFEQGLGSFGNSVEIAKFQFNKLGTRPFHSFMDRLSLLSNLLLVRFFISVMSFGVIHQVELVTSTVEEIRNTIDRRARSKEWNLYKALKSKSDEFRELCDVLATFMYQRLILSDSEDNPKISMSEEKLKSRIFDLSEEFLSIVVKPWYWIFIIYREVLEASSLENLEKAETSFRFRNWPDFYFRTFGLDQRFVNYGSTIDAHSMRVQHVVSVITWVVLHQSSLEAMHAKASFKAIRKEAWERTRRQISNDLRKPLVNYLHSYIRTGRMDFPFIESAHQVVPQKPSRIEVPREFRRDLFISAPYIQALTPQQAERLVHNVWYFTAKFLLAHIDTTPETLDPLFEVIMKLPLEALAGTYKQLMEAYQSLDLQDNVRYAGVQQFLPFVSLCGWIVLLYYVMQNNVRFNVPDFTQEQIQDFIIEEAEERWLLPEVSRELAVAAFDILPHIMSDDI